MNLKIHDKLIHEVDSPQGLLYRMIIIYTCCAAGVILTLSLMFGDTSRINFYFLINTCTIMVLAWFIRKSFNIKSIENHLLVFRGGLFLMLNSSLASMAGGLGLISRDNASIIAALLFAPAMVMIIFAFNGFIAYVNNSYRHVINMSLTDELTGLPNRRHLNLILKDSEYKHAVICIADIDHFKKINDAYGHEAGDRVLRKIGLVMNSFANEQVFISRSGGEEFTFVIFNNSKPDEIIREIKNAVSNNEIDVLNVTISIGVAIKQKHEPSSSALASADDALYKSKKSGRNCITYSSA